MNEPQNRIAISAMLARGLDPATGEPLPDSLPAPQQPETRSTPGSQREKKIKTAANPPGQRTTPAARGFRFTVIDEPILPPARNRRSEDHDALAIVLSLTQYLARRRESGSKRLSAADRFRASAKLALEQQWTIEYWRARALHFETLLCAAEEPSAVLSLPRT